MGFYARRRKKRTQIIMSLWKKFKKLNNKRIYWRERIMKSFGHDPLTCPNAGRNDHERCGIQKIRKHVRLVKTKAGRSV